MNAPRRDHPLVLLEGGQRGGLPPTSGLRRAVRLTEIGGLVVLQAVLWLAYRRQHLRRRMQGAVARWENDPARRRTRQAGNRQTKRR